MREPAEFPIEDIAEYWQLVRDALTAGGMSKKEAAAVAKAYREYMKPAGWAFYNRDPEDAAEYAIKYAAWMRKSQEQAASKPAAKRTKHPAGNADELPTKKEFEQLPRWARAAFAARCARRVEPLFRHRWPQAPEGYVSDVERVIKLAEQSIANTADAVKLDDTANASEAAHDAPAAAGSAARAARAAAFAAYDPVHAAAAAVHAVAAAGRGIILIIRQDFQRVLDESRHRQWTDDTPVPPAVFGPLWPEGPPADWPALAKPTQLKLTVQVPDTLDDATVLGKLKTLSAALARLNVAGGGHGLKLIPPIEFTQEQDKGLADVVREEGEKPKGRGHARGGR